VQRNGSSCFFLSATLIPQAWLIMPGLKIKLLQNWLPWQPGIDLAG
jgi:hypothetical protein